MANTPNTVVRIPPELTEAARAGIGQPDAGVAVLVRAGLAVLAGYTLSDALVSAQARRGRPHRLAGGR